MKKINPYAGWLVFCFGVLMLISCPEYQRAVALGTVNAGSK
jgi:hypothetical protein